jgi:hypothetical protein
MNVLRGEVLAAEIELLSDSDEAVRVAALTAISRTSDPKRVEILNRALAHPSASLREKLMIQGGLYGVAQGAEKEAHLTAIHEIMDQHQDDPALITYGFKVLLRISPSDSASADRFQAAFTQASTAKELLPALYRFLVRNRPDFLRKRFVQDIRAPFAALRITALNSILELCPSERWTMIQLVANDASFDPQSKTIARRVAGFLGGKVNDAGVIQLPSPGADRCAMNQVRQPVAKPAKK